jgi:predicted nuclease of restriction endonuclease-like (RecB) superfamily
VVAVAQCAGRDLTRERILAGRHNEGVGFGEGLGLQFLQEVMRVSRVNRQMMKKQTSASISGDRRVLSEIRQLIDSARGHVAVAANLSMVNLYWNIGRIITEDIQKNPERASSGEQLIEELGRRLTSDYGRGFSARNLWDMKRFSAEFQILQAAPAESGNVVTIDFRKHYHLGWTYSRNLMGLSDPRKRVFYFQQAATERWSTRELDRRIAGALFERVALSRDTRKLVALERKMGAPETVRYEDVFKDPYVLDFLGLKGAYSEKDLEGAIIRNLEQFLSELGSDFCFIARQYPMRIDDTDYFLDLLFFHRGLHCLVAIDLKLGTFTAADKGQMDLYLAWLKENEWPEGENEPVGRLPGVGKVTGEKLGKLGIQIVRELRGVALPALEQHFDRHGRRLYELARGVDESEVVPDRPTQSISVEDTFERDMLLADTEPMIRRLAEKLWSGSLKESRAARTVVLKMKTSEFKVLTRSHTPVSPPSSCEELTAIALKLRERVALGRQQRYRLVGVGLSNFREAELDAAQPTLFE